MTTVRFDAACRAIRGARKRQEDSATLWPGPSTYEAAERPKAPDGELLLVLADGMGGHAGGEIASQLSCDTFVSAFASTAADDTRKDRFVASLAKANDAIADRVDKRPELDGMGATLVAVHLSAGSLDWISVGDSPLYLIRSGEIALLNEDHSLAPALDQLVREGRMSEADARNDPRRHMLRSAVTGDDLELIDISRNPLQLARGDVVVCASDGIHTIDADEIARIVTGYSSDGPAEIAEALLRGVETVADPIQDNTTVIVVQPVFEPPASA